MAAAMVAARAMAVITARTRTRTWSKPMQLYRRSIEMYTDAYLEANPTLKTAKEMVDRVMGVDYPGRDLTRFLADFLDPAKAHTLFWEEERITLIIKLIVAGDITPEYFASALNNGMVTGWGFGFKETEEQPDPADQGLLRLILSGEVSIVGANSKFTVEHKTVVGMWNPDNPRQIYFYPMPILGMVAHELEFRDSPRKIMQQLVKGALNADLGSLTKVVRIDGKPQRVMVVDAVKLGIMSASDYDLA